MVRQATNDQIWKFLTTSELIEVYRNIPKWEQTWKDVETKRREIAEQMKKSGEPNIE